MTEQLVNARQLADYFGLSAGTVLDWFEAGRIGGFRLGGRKGGPVRFRLTEVEATLEGWRSGPGSATIGVTDEMGGHRFHGPAPDTGG